jgi:NAD+ synthase/NAD+ synthase (glutamine-hydrolysing)
MLRIAVAQFNATVGDLTGNVERIIACAAAAKARGAQVLLTPELALCGYPPEDLLLRPDFYRACSRALDDLARRIEESAPGLAAVVGHPEEHAGRRFNAATVIENGQKKAVYRKMRLPNYEVFDEKRYFEAGSEACVVMLGGVRFGINICADIWEAGAAELSREAGAELLLVLNASPCHLEKHQQRAQVLGERIAATGIPAIYANLVGGQDELVFDGASFALDAHGNCRMRLPSFEEALGIVDFDHNRLHSEQLADELQVEAEAYRALVLGVRDYIGKSGFKGAIIGLSGGIDSALTLCVAVDALGADKVHAVMMPSPYTAQMSLDDSREMIRKLGVRYDEIAIAPAMQTYAAMLDPLFAGLPQDTTEENIQARIRGNILMALSNKTGALVLTTGNKSEMAVGYCTLYGDMAGGFAVIKDVYKTLVYRLSRYRNTLSPVIPENIIVRPPSAELKPDQTDQDSLPRAGGR